MNQVPFLDYIVLYTSDAEVYKILLDANPKMLNRAKKVGIQGALTFVKDNLPKNKIVSPKEKDISKGAFIIQFSFLTRDFKIFSGEGLIFFNMK
jgi:hypothetical protein